MESSATTKAFLPFAEPASHWLGPHVMDLLERAGYGLLFLSEAGTLVFCNVSARKALGWQHRLLIGTQLDELGLQEAAGLDLKSLLKQQHTAMRTRVHRPDGTEQEWVIAPVRFGPLQERGLLMLLRPIRETVEVLAAAGERMAAVCHNLNNQLGRATAWVSVAEHKSNGDPSILSSLAELRQSLKGFQHQIEEILHPLRAHQKTRLDLIPLVEQAWATACAALGDLWACQLRLESSRDSILISVPEEKLSTVLHNLLKNAMEASPSGWVCCSIEQARDMVILEIADGGDGVQEEMLLQPATTKQAGHGLGLSDAQRALLGLGGSLDIAQLPEGGRTLIVRLPTG